MHENHFFFLLSMYPQGDTLAFLAARLFALKNTEFCHAYKVNYLRECSENQCVHRLISYHTQTFCGLKEISVTAIELQRRDQPCIKLLSQNTLIEQLL